MSSLNPIFVTLSIAFYGELLKTDCRSMFRRFLATTILAINRMEICSLHHTEQHLGSPLRLVYSMAPALGSTPFCSMSFRNILQDVRGRHPQVGVQAYQDETDLLGKDAEIARAMDLFD